MSGRVDERQTQGDLALDRNTLVIRLVGENVTVHLNDQLVVDQAKMQNYFNKKGPLPEAGPIQLQTHGAPVQWRNLFVKEL